MRKFYLNTGKRFQLPITSVIIHAERIKQINVASALSLHVDCVYCTICIAPNLSLGIIIIPATSGCHICVLLTQLEQTNEDRSKKYVLCINPKGLKL